MKVLFALCALFSVCVADCSVDLQCASEDRLFFPHESCYSMCWEKEIPETPSASNSSFSCDNVTCSDLPNDCQKFRLPGSCCDVCLTVSLPSGDSGSGSGSGTEHECRPKTCGANEIPFCIASQCCPNICIRKAVVDPPHDNNNNGSGSGSGSPQCVACKSGYLEFSPPRWHGCPICLKAIQQDPNAAPPPTNDCASQHCNSCAPGQVGIRAPGACCATCVTLPQPLTPPPPSNPCSTPCKSCPANHIPVMLPNACCPTCIKHEVPDPGPEDPGDPCANLVCHECQSGEIKANLPGHCCGTCLQQAPKDDSTPPPPPDPCAGVVCTACTAGQKTVQMPGQCCGLCIVEAVVTAPPPPPDDCGNVVCETLTCLKKFRAPGQCCEMCLAITTEDPPPENVDICSQITCPQLACAVSDQYKSDGQCCPVCTIPEPKDIPEDPIPCEELFDCPAVTCNCPITFPGSCCKWCLPIAPCENCDHLAVCGNTLCEPYENDDLCSFDCGGAGHICGNTVCETRENSDTCPQDCFIYYPPKPSNPNTQLEGFQLSYCGNGFCENWENAGNCVDDCPVRPSRCGDGKCDGNESPSNCRADCDINPFKCGNGVCDSNEHFGNCMKDCSFPLYPFTCPNEVCDANETPETCLTGCDPSACIPDGVCSPSENSHNCWQDCPSDTICGNHICETGENEQNCFTDCASHISLCRNGVCDVSENSVTCPEDCQLDVSACGNRLCESFENPGSCFQDCPASPLLCGDSICHFDENAGTCPEDCDISSPLCGNGACDSGENAGTCEIDCLQIVVSTCPNGICDLQESDDTCPEDCVSVPLSSNCTTVCEVANCTGIETCVTTCVITPLPVCGDGNCTSGENPHTCPLDCLSSPICGNSLCEINETAISCPEDCLTHQICGNGVCESAENEENCPDDCSSTIEICGNGICALSESPSTCIHDCPLNPPNCPNGICDADENAGTCPLDCDLPGPFCGNGVCDAGENVGSCSADCTSNLCGNGVCDLTETVSSCSVDCYFDPVDCPDGFCSISENSHTCPQDCPSTSICGNGLCESDETPVTCFVDCSLTFCGDLICQSFENPDICEIDCASEPTQCPDGYCQLNESPITCPEDCTSVPVGCGNFICESGENSVICPQDCHQDPPYCGNGACDFNENYVVCSIDCGNTPPNTCPDGTCDPGETSDNCLADCPINPVTCGNGVCDATENTHSCIQDCPITPICGNGLCDTTEIADSCPDDCDSTLCGNGVCDLSENPDTCSSDCTDSPPNCPNDICNLDENFVNCPSDCPVHPLDCGNGFCDNSESVATCPQDCATDPSLCGNLLCDPTENAATCPSDCNGDEMHPCAKKQPNQLCDVDPLTCQAFTCQLEVCAPSPSTYIDDISPTISCPTSIVATNDFDQCGALDLYSIADIVVADNCLGSTLTQTGGLGANTLQPVGTTVNTFKVTDIGGHTAWCSFSVTVVDTQVPAISCPANATIPTDLHVCNARYIYSQVGYTDNCPSPLLAKTGGISSGGVFLLGTTTNSFMVTDQSRNKQTCSFSVTVKDLEPPQLQSLCPASTVIPTESGLCTAAFSYVPPNLFVDNCDGSLVPVQTTGLLPGSAFPLGNTTNTFAVTDIAGNANACVFNVQVIDTELPTITCPANVSTGNDLSFTFATVNYTVIHNDNCMNYSLSLVQGVASGGHFPLGTTVLIYRVTDVALQTAECSFQVEVFDHEPPVLICPANVTVGTTFGYCSALQFIHPNISATDNTGAVTITQIQGPTNGSDLGLGSYAIRYQAEDGSGNTATCQFTIYVNDVESPVMVCPASSTINNDQGACGATISYSVSSSDNCEVASQTQIVGSASGSFISQGTSNFTYVAVDNAGNAGNCSFQITVNDVEPAIVTCPAPVTVPTEPNVCQSHASYSLPAVVDNCPWTLRQVAGLASGSVFQLGLTSNTFVIDPQLENCTFTVNVVDAEKPKLPIAYPSDLYTNTDPGRCNAVYSYATPLFLDNCDGTLNSTRASGIASGGVFPRGNTTNKFVATDAAGNSNSWTFVVHVTDAEVPTISCPADIFANTDSSSNYATVHYSIGSSDNCPSYTVSRVQGLASGDRFPTGTTIVVYQVADGVSLTAQCSFKVIVTDTADPFEICPTRKGKPNIQVETPSQIPILCGSSTVFSFGTYLRASGAKTKTFNIFNTAPTYNNTNLEVSNIVSTGGFTVTTSRSLNIQPGTSKPLTISFTAGSTGKSDGRVTITSNDPYQPTCTFKISINVITNAPEIGVHVTTAGITSGDIQSGSTYPVSFGNVPQSTGSSISQSFTIRNDGDRNLNIISISLVSNTGFIISSTYAGIIAPSSSANFVVNMLQDTVGEKTATVQIMSNDGDLDEVPFEFYVAGLVGIAEVQVMDVTTAGANYYLQDDVSVVEFGLSNITEPVTRTFVISNVGGTAPLHIGQLAPLPPGYTVQGFPAGTVLAVGQVSATFNVTFNATTEGTWWGQISFTNNNNAKNPFTWSVHATTIELYWKLTMPRKGTKWAMYLPQRIEWDFNVRSHNIRLFVVAPYDVNISMPLKEIISTQDEPWDGTHNAVNWKPFNLVPSDYRVCAIITHSGLPCNLFEGRKFCSDVFSLTVRG